MTLNFPADITSVTLDSGKYFQIKNYETDKYAVFDKNLKQLTKFCFDYSVHFYERNKVLVYLKKENLCNIKLKENNFFKRYKK